MAESDTARLLRMESGGVETPVKVRMAAAGELAVIQRVTELAHSASVSDQQQGALELSNRLCADVALLDRVASSGMFGALAHALSRLIASEDAMVSAYAARSVKMMCTNAKLREDAVGAGMVLVLVAAATRWAEEVGCLREVLASLQNVCLDAKGAKAVLGGGLGGGPGPGDPLGGGDGVGVLARGVGQRDVEVRMLAVAASCNLLAHATHDAALSAASGPAAAPLVPLLVGRLAHAGAAERLFCVSAVANGALRPVLGEALRACGAVDAIRRFETPADADAGGGGTGGAVSQTSHAARLAHDRLVGGPLASSASSSGGGAGGSDHRPKPPETFTFPWGNQRILDVTRSTRVSGLARLLGATVVACVLMLVSRYFLDIVNYGVA